MTTHYYVYYRVARPDDAATRNLVSNLLTQVERATGIAGRLLVRTEDAHTWMEIYEPVIDATSFEAALLHAVDTSGFASVLAAGSTRHVERFRAA